MDVDPETRQHYGETWILCAEERRGHDTPRNGRDRENDFLVEYLSLEKPRHRLHKGLNRVNFMNAFARTLSSTNMGSLENGCCKISCGDRGALNVLINVISVWNTVYLTEAVKVLKAQKVDENLFAYIFPLGWEHTNCPGEYQFTTTDIRPFTTVANREIIIFIPW